MVSHIPQNILDEVINRVDIVELISGYFPLKRAGRNFKALCPFHHEKTPSFMVNPERQIFHCFGCGKGGNVFTFLIEYERMDFIEAVRTLASKTGVVLPQWDSSDKTAGLVSSIYKIDELSCAFYQKTLDSQNGTLARQYLAKRNIGNDTIRLFRLGLSFDRWDSLLVYLRTKNINLALLEKSGLVCPRKEGGYYDRFRNRLIFPIFDVKNRVIAFGARVIVDDRNVAKYINSPESLIYIKGRHLYGLNLTRESIRQDDCAVVVEGYFDCISVYQAGVKNVAASLGTSLTVEQIRLLKRYTRNVVMVYDSDSAGQDATLRSLDIFTQEGMDVRVALLPPNYDPDSFMHKFGAADFTDRLTKAMGLFDYKLNLLISRHGLKKPEAKAHIAREILISLNYLKDAVLKSEYIRRFAQVLDIREDAFTLELSKISDKKLYKTLELAHSSPSRINPTEKLLINLLIRESGLISQLKSAICSEDFQDSRTARIFSLICDLFSQGKAIEPKHLIGYLNDQESAFLLSELLTVDDEVTHKGTEEVINDCIVRIKQQSLHSRCQNLQKQIRIAQQQGEHERLNRLVAEFRDLSQRKMLLKEVK